MSQQSRTRVRSSAGQSGPSSTTLQAPLLLHTYSHLPDRSIEHDPAPSHSKSSLSCSAEDQTILPDLPASLARYAGPAPFGADLNHGFETHTARDPERDAVEYLDGVLESLLISSQRRKSLAVTDGATRPDGVCPSESEGLGPKSNSIITWRGILTRLLIAGAASGGNGSTRPEDGWELNAQPFAGGVYMILHARGGRQAREEKAARESQFAKQAYHGYAFESYSTSTYPRSSSSSRSQNSDPSEPGRPASSHEGEKSSYDPNPVGWGGEVNTNVQWCCVVKSRIEEGASSPAKSWGRGERVKAGVGLYYGGEVDCMEGPWEGRPRLDRCVELKTNMVLESDRQRLGFERKLLKHWAQSYLLGIPTVEIGFRDRSGFLRSVERFKTLEIPRIVRNSTPAHLPTPWDPHACLGLMRKICERIVREVLAVDPLRARSGRGGREGSMSGVGEEVDKEEDGDYSPSRPNDGNRFELGEEAGNDHDPEARSEARPTTISELLATPPPIFRITFDPTRTSSVRSNIQDISLPPTITICRLDPGQMSQEDLEFMRPEEQADGEGGGGRWGFLTRDYVAGMMRLKGYS